MNNIIVYIIAFPLCIGLAACSYDLKHITLNEPSDSGWTEVKKENTSGVSESTNPTFSSPADKENQAGSGDLSESSSKLRELKELKDEGLLTEEEYEKKRKVIVDGM